MSTLPASRRPRSTVLPTVLRVVGTCVWVACVSALFSVPSAVVAGIGMIAASLLAGFLIGRWWALAIPVGLGVFGLIASVTFADEGGDAQPIFYGMLTLFIALAFALLLAAGIGLAKLRARRSG